MTREFILNTLLPYKEDPSTCAIDRGTCKYLDSKGRKCALGKHLIEGIHQTFNGVVDELDVKYGLNNILTEEAKLQGIPINVWKKMQNYHDELANGRTSYIIGIISVLEIKTGLKFPELYFNEGRNL